MIVEQSYRKSLYVALMLHVLLALLLMTESTTKRPVLVNEAKNFPGQMTPVEQTAKAQKEIVKAVSVNSQEVMETVNRLKQERTKQLQAEKARQQALNKQVEQARKARVMEQQRLAKLKDETAKIAIARKKQIEEEQKRLKQLALQKEQEAKRLQELKEKQKVLEKKQQEAEKLAVLKKKETEDKAKADKAKAALAAAEQVKKQQQAAAAQAAAQQAARDAASKAQLAGEVDKYKALILNAIGGQWILPENVDPGLSSQFRIRLAPDGAVLEVSLIRSSGDPILDRSAQSAIYKASPLPVPGDPVTFNLFRDISLTVRPENVRG